MCARSGLPRPAGCAPSMAHPPGQWRPVRVDALVALRAIDLPVDVIVVLEQQERARQAQRTECALRKFVASCGGEHVFVKIGMPTDGNGANVCTHWPLSPKNGLPEPISGSSCCNGNCRRRQCQGWEAFGMGTRWPGGSP